jgi:hypothetical protein
LIQDGDTSLKIGKWEFYKEGVWGIDEVVYSKEISLSAFSTENASQHTNFNIKVLENGKWKQPIIDLYNNQKTFYITKKQIASLHLQILLAMALPYYTIRFLQIFQCNFSY